MRVQDYLGGHDSTFNCSSPHTLHVHDYPDGHGSTFNCSIASVAPQRVVKLVEIIIYNQSIVQYLSRSSAHYMAKSARNTVHIQVQKYCEVNCTHPCFVPTLELAIPAC